MAAIETLDGIEKIGRLQYVVTKNVAMAAGIDDMLNCVFNQRDGGILRFASGNETTFTACSFVEETTALALAYRQNGRERFMRGAKTRFEGCVWKQECTRSDFDTAPGTLVTFAEGPGGTPCQWLLSAGRTQYNHFRGGAIEALYIDHMDGGGDLEFAVSGTYAGLSLKDNTIGGTKDEIADRQVVFIGGGSQNFRMIKLGSRNISIHSLNFTVNLIDPLGYIPVSPQGIKGTANTYRTFKSLPFDPKAGAPISVKCFLRNTDTSTTLIDGYSDQINAELLVRRRILGATEIETLNFKIGYMKFGTVPTAKTFEFLDRSDGSPLDDGAVLMLPDAQFTLSEADARALTTQGNTRDAFDCLGIYSEDNHAGEGRWLVSRVGDMLDCGAYSVTATASSNLAVTASQITLKAATFAGDIKTTGSVSLDAISDGHTIIDSQDVTISILPASLTLDNAVLNLPAGSDVTAYEEINTGGYRATADGEYVARGKDASIIDANGFNVTVITDPLPTPSTFIWDGDGTIRWAIYDQTGTFIESGDGDKTLAHAGGVDSGTWTIVSHKIGHVPQIDRWVSDDGSVTNSGFVGAEIKRSTGEPAVSDDPFPDVSTSIVPPKPPMTKGKIRTLLANTTVSPQQIINSQQSFINTDAGLNWVRLNEPTSYPTWASMNGITYLLSKEMFTYDSVPGATPEAAISATLISSATHDNIELINGGVIVSGGAVTSKDIATAVWASLSAENTNDGTMGAALGLTFDYSKIAAQNTQT